MTIAPASMPFQYFTDISGGALENGQIFIGQPGLEARSSPKASYFDAAGGIPTGTATGAAVRTSGGYPVNNSRSAATIFVDGDYSITVLDRSGLLVFAVLNSPWLISGVSGSSPTFQTLASVLADTSILNGYVAGTPVKTEAEGGLYLVAPTIAVDYHLVTAGGVRLYVRGNVISSTQTNGTANLASIAYAIKAQVIVKTGETVKLVCNPTAGDNIQAMTNWLMYNHQVDAGGSFYLEIADGYHNVSTYIDTYRAGYIQGTGSPDFIQISSATFGAPTSNIYTATVVLAAALPARVVAGYALGMQNVKSTIAAEGAEALNGACIVKTIAGDRLSFTADFRAHGVAPTAFTSPDNALTLSLTANQCVISKCCLRTDSTGWDGAAREGFINVLGGELHLKNMAFSYAGIADAHDMLFAKHGRLMLDDYVTVAGAGSKVLRTGYGGRIYANRGTFGGGGFAANIYQGVGNDGLEMIRCGFGGASAELISATANTRVFGTACIGAGGLRGLRTTYADANITMIGGTRLNHCGTGIQIDKGTVEISTSEVVGRCTDAFAIVGVGYIVGSPTLTLNTNAAIAANYPINGGGWYQDSTKLIDDKLPRIVTALDFPSIAANSYQDITAVYTGVVFGMVIDVTATSAMVALPFEVTAFVSAADQITYRAKNYSTGAIDPAAKTYYARARATT